MEKITAGYNTFCKSFKAILTISIFVVLTHYWLYISILNCVLAIHRPAVRFDGGITLIFAFVGYRSLYCDLTLLKFELLI